MKRAQPAALLLAALLLPSPTVAAPHDLVISGGTIYDGTGAPGFAGWVAIDGDRIAAVGRGKAPAALRTIDARSQAVAPGFINMLSWATESLMIDGRGLSDLKQGVTLEVMGEGWTMGPMNADMKAKALARQQDFKYPITWDTFGGYMEMLEKRGIAPNVASFVGATTIRIHELGEDDVDPTPAQLAAMTKLVKQAMNEGALGVGSSLIYAPAAYAETPELVALATASAQCGGSYISHIRSEEGGIEAAIDELVTIARQSGGPAEIYHLKISGERNWPKRDAVLARIEAARQSGLDIRANMYSYTAGSTGLDASMPTWVQAGGVEQWVKRLKDPAIRQKVLAEMRAPSGWENLALATGDPSRVLFIGFRNQKLRPLIGKTLAEVAAMRGTSPEDTIIDLVIEDESRVDTIYFLMSEDNVKAMLALPWVSLGSDAEASAPEGLFLTSSTHPRAYGNVARFLGKYVRDEKVAPLEQAIHRLTGLPAARLKLADRGTLAAGKAADVVIFDPATIADHATYENPRQFATGVSSVFVNGVQVLADGEPTGKPAGRFLKGPGFNRCPS